MSYIKKVSKCCFILVPQVEGWGGGKKKLAKLLYFADFDCMKKSKSITGDIYKATKGPLPVSLQDVVDEMLDKNMIKVDSVLEW